MLWADLRICGFAEMVYLSFCALPTPGKNETVKGEVVGEGSRNVVSESVSGEVLEEYIVSTASMSSLRSVWARLRSKGENEGKQYGLWRHKLKAGVSMFRQAQHTQDAVGGFADLRICSYHQSMFRQAQHDRKY